MGCCGSRPTGLQKAASFSKSIAKAAKDLASGKNIRSDSSTQQIRLSICRKCEKYDKRRVSCKKCGCFLKVKVTLTAESCPLGRW